MMDREQTEHAQTARRRHVLVVDDSAQGREALARYLELNAFVVHVASGGLAAADILNQEPVMDVVVTDLVLPDLDGREVARLAKQRTPPPLVVLITGWGVDSHPEDLMASGIDLLFYKPIDVRELLKKIDEALPSEPGPSPAA
jgi:CheY-like chemotaxis protein